MKIPIVRLEVIKERSVRYGKKQIKGAEDLAEIGRLLIGKADRECLLVLCLSCQNTINSIQIASIGTLDASLFHPREILKLAVVSNASAIAIMHNHPGGRTKPSDEDIKATEALIQASKILGIDVLDHLIITEGNYFSFLDNGVCSFT